MKKKYGKPTISFESFAFSSNVAGSCGHVNGIHAENVCSVYGTFSEPSLTCQFFDNGYSIFYDGMCLMTPQEDDPNNLCFHVSTDETRMFAS